MAETAEEPVVDFYMVTTHYSILMLQMDTLQVRLIKSLRRTISGTAAAVEVLRPFRRLSPAKVGLLPFLFPRVVERMKGLSSSGFNISGAGASGICRIQTQCCCGVLSTFEAFLNFSFILQFQLLPRLNYKHEVKVRPLLTLTSLIIDLSKNIHWRRQTTAALCYIPVPWEV